MLKVSNEPSETLQPPCHNLHKAAHMVHNDQYDHSLNNHILLVRYQLSIKSKVWKENGVGVLAVRWKRSPARAANLSP